jgi:hypothetical protein
MTAILLPTSGIIRGLTAIMHAGFFGESILAIMRRGSFGNNPPLDIAARSGALCTVIRTKDWKLLPRTSDLTKGVRIRQKIHLGRIFSKRPSRGPSLPRDVQIG